MPIDFYFDLKEKFAINCTQSIQYINTAEAKKLIFMIL